MLRRRDASTPVELPPDAVSKADSSAWSPPHKWGFSEIGHPFVGVLTIRALPIRVPIGTLDF